MNTDTDSDTHSDTSYSDEEEIIEKSEPKYKSKKAIKKSTKNIISLTTCGGSANDPIIKKNAAHAKMCEYCGLYYDNRMIAIADAGDQICQHCYFFLNFENPEPKYSWNLEKYVNLCVSEHNMETCTKFQNSGNCFLCFAILDLKSIQKNENNNSIKEQLDDKNTRKITFNTKSGKKVELCNNEMIYL
jgi:hypothetical protein